MVVIISVPHHWLDIVLSGLFLINKRELAKLWGSSALPCWYWMTKNNSLKIIVWLCKTASNIVTGRKRCSISCIPCVRWQENEIDFQFFIICLFPEKLLETSCDDDDSTEILCSPPHFQPAIRHSETSCKQFSWSCELSWAGHWIDGRAGRRQPRRTSFSRHAWPSAAGPPTCCYGDSQIRQWDTVKWSEKGVIQG